MDKKINQIINNNLDNDKQNESNLANNIDYLNEQKIVKNEWDKMKQDQEDLSYYSLENIAKNLSDAVQNLKKNKPEKQVFQIYLTKDVMHAIEMFMRANKITKKTDAVEMLLRLALGMKQI